MGKVKHLAKAREFFKKTPVGSISSLRKIVGEKNTYVNLMLNKMVGKGELYRVGRGMYSVSDDPVLAVFCFKPGYLGLQEALSIHGLWEQETNAVILTSKVVREGVRKVNGSNVLLKRIPSSLFFGVEYLLYGDFYVPVSDVEKTFIDLVYFDCYIDKEVLKSFREKMDKRKLKEYLKRCDSLVAEKVKGLIL